LGFSARGSGEAGVSPPESGGVAEAVRKWRASSSAPKTGWFPSGMSEELFLKRDGRGTTPSAPTRSFGHFLDVAATPPDSGGDTLTEPLPPAGNSQYEDSGGTPPGRNYFFSSSRAITRRWISLVPSPIVQSFTSR
jgi:hypothetical protein